MKQSGLSDRGAISSALMVAAAVVVLAAGAGLWFFLSGDEPDAVDLESAAAVVSTTSTSAAEDLPPAEEEPEDSGETVGVDGTWTVDNSIGEFSFEDATSSFVGFRVAEELASIGATEAVGRTPQVTGSIEIEGTTLVSGSFEADFTAIVSNDSRRDNKIKDALDTGQFPTGEFVLTEPIDFGTIPTEGETLSVTATGDLTVHGITNTIQMPLEARLVNEVIVVVGSVDILFADYGVEVPSAVIVLSVEDHGPIELQLFFTR